MTKHFHKNIYKTVHCTYAYITGPRISSLYTDYKVAHLVANLGWVDLNFDYSTVCLILPGLMGVWQKWLGSWARWWNSQIQVN